MLLYLIWIHQNYRGLIFKMADEKHLDGKGKGEVIYDYKYDTLTFKIKDRNYSQSFEFQNLVVDIDEEGFITGIRVFDASDMLGVDKVLLKDVASWEFNTRMEEKIITINLKFSCRRRNKIIPFFSEKETYTQDLVREAPIKIEDSSVECAISA